MTAGPVPAGPADDQAPAGGPGASGFGPDDLEGMLRWAARQGDPPAVELGCREHPTLDRGHARRVVVRLPVCLADLTLAAHLTLLGAGLAEIVLRVDGCTRAATAVAVAGEAGALAERSGCRAATVQAARPRGRRRPVHTLDQLPMSRREVFRLTVGAAAGPDRPPRQQVVDALRRATTGDPTILADLPAPGAVLEAEGCTACGVCARACPSHALTLMHQGLTVMLTQDPLACRACGDCVRLCPAAALRSTGETRPWSWLLHPTPVTLGRLSTQTCARCGTAFTRADPATTTPTAAGATLCRVCTFRRVHPFGSTRPPERDGRRPLP